MMLLRTMPHRHGQGYGTAVGMIASANIMEGGERQGQRESGAQDGSGDHRLLGQGQCM